jgi:hypothetical protein
LLQQIEGPDQPDLSKLPIIASLVISPKELHSTLDSLSGFATDVDILWQTDSVVLESSSSNGNVFRKTIFPREACQGDEGVVYTPPSKEQSLKLSLRLLNTATVGATRGELAMKAPLCIQHVQSAGGGTGAALLTYNLAQRGTLYAMIASKHIEEDEL